MTILSRRRAWREPPILFQILVLLTGGLVVAQLVTLLLTMVLPPAPPAQHSMADIVAALRGGDERQASLSRGVQSGPPDVSGTGWFTSDASRHRLAAMLGAADTDVRLAFYAPLPFAGITAPPSQPPLPIVTPDLSPATNVMQPISWSVSDEPLSPLSARLAPARLLLVDQGGPPGGGGAGGGGFPATMSGYPGGGQQGGFPRGTGQRGGIGGQGGGRSGDSGVFRQGQRGVGRSASPGDLDRQPAAPGADGGDGTRGGGDRGIDGGRSGALPGTGSIPIPTEGFDPRMFAAPQQETAPSQLSPRVSAPSPGDLARQPVAPDASHEASRPVTRSPAVVPVPAELATAAPVVSITPAPVSKPERVRHDEPAALPIAPTSRALFGLAPAPFVEGDFVAAERLPDGRWTVVQPQAEGFPNAWQRRIILWFGIAFAIVAPVGWLYARHIVRPLARFTEAAEQLGRDPSAALVALEGPAEIGRAARAFNAMQSRLRSFVDDRTAMVGAISHDLRTPLTRLRFRIEEVDDEAVREGMNEEVSEMEAMITSVLSFIRDASTPNVRERLDLAMLVEDVAQDATMVGGDVTLETMASAPVEVDVLGMRRLLANLVENAVKYGDRARIRLAVDEDAAIAEIRDDGPGVPEDELERAFEPFYRASNAQRSGKEGTGLGLAVCRSIARAHGGDVRLLRSDQGFAAELRLPLAYDAGRIAA